MILNSAPNPTPLGSPAGGLARESRVAVDIRSLRVDYRDFVAVNNLTLAVPPGEILGIVGPNGAGKTSTFRVLATLMEPTHGDIFFDGIDIAENPRQARRYKAKFQCAGPHRSRTTTREWSSRKQSPRHQPICSNQNQSQYSSFHVATHQRPSGKAATSVNTRH